jgi:hypothetical protein
MSNPIHAKLTLTWVRQTTLHHIYEVKFPGQSRASIVSIPKNNPDPNYCLPTTKPPKELICEISEVGSEVE